MQRQRLAVTETLFYEGSWVYLWIKHEDWIGVRPYPVPQEVDLAEPLKFRCVPGGGTLNIELDLAAWRPTIAGLQSETEYCLVCGTSKVSVRAGYYDAGWPAKKPLFCSRPEGSYQSEELILEIVDE